MREGGSGKSLSRRVASCPRVASRVVPGSVKSRSRQASHVEFRRVESVVVSSCHRRSQSRFRRAVRACRVTLSRFCPVTSKVTSSPAKPSRSSQVLSVGQVGSSSPVLPSLSSQPSRRVPSGARRSISTKEDQQ